MLDSEASVWLHRVRKILCEKQSTCRWVPSGCMNPTFFYPELCYDAITRSFAFNHPLITSLTGRIFFCLLHGIWEGAGASELPYSTIIDSSVHVSNNKITTSLLIKTGRGTHVRRRYNSYMNERPISRSTCCPHQLPSNSLNDLLQMQEASKVIVISKDLCIQLSGFHSNEQAVSFGVKAYDLSIYHDIPSEILLFSNQKTIGLQPYCP